MEPRCNAPQLHRALLVETSGNKSEHKKHRRYLPSMAIVTPSAGARSGMIAMSFPIRAPRRTRVVLFLRRFSRSVFSLKWNPQSGWPMSTGMALWSSSWSTEDSRSRICLASALSCFRRALSILYGPPTERPHGYSEKVLLRPQIRAEADGPGHWPAGGCQSSTLFPSGSMTQANFPYSESSILSRTLQPSSRKTLTRAWRSSTR